LIAPKRELQMSKHEVVITAAGLLSGAGDSLEKHIDSALGRGAVRPVADFSMRDFKPAPYLSDKRTLKVVSKTDALGIAAVELLKKDAALAEGTYAAERVGLYVGAPPASPWNVEDYFDAIRKSQDPVSGEFSEHAFGKEAMNVKPTTLLAGLPNNVLCYGSILLSAKGPNSNYTSGEVSGQLALVNAARRLQLGKLDAAIAGGFSAHGEPVVEGMMQQNGLLRAGGDDVAIGGVAIEPGGGGTILAAGAAFYMLERKDSAKSRNARVLAEFAGGAQASSATGRFGGDSSESAVGLAVRRCLLQAEVHPGQVGLVMTSASGIGELDQGERRALSRFFTGHGPAFGTTARVWGNLMEAGGLGEIALASALAQQGAGNLPEALRLAHDVNSSIDMGRPYSLIVRTSVFGEVSCLLVRTAKEAS
jgi:3-oxoacyl-(acyl-carrier-protein) synthase